VARYQLIGREAVNVEVCRDYVQGDWLIVPEAELAAQVVDIQTRETPSAWRSAAALVVRLPPPQGNRRVPSPAAWETFAPFLGALPGLLAEGGVHEVRFRGGRTSRQRWRWARPCR
jgi:hypothetical protein